MDSFLKLRSFINVHIFKASLLNFACHIPCQTQGLSFSVVLPKLSGYYLYDLLILSHFVVIMPLLK